MPFTPSSSSILGSGGAVVASDLTVDGSTVTVDETNNRLGVNTDAPLGTVGVDGDLYFQPTTISTSHVYTDGSLDIRCTDNLKIGTDGADSVKIGRTNTALAKVAIRSGGENDLVVSNSMVGIGTETPTQALELDGNIQLSPSAISTAHVFTEGSLDLRATANIKIGTDGADSVKIGRTNTGAAKCHVRSGGENDLVVSDSMVGIGTDSPDHTLSVAGDIDLTGALSFGGAGAAITSIDTDLSSVSGSDDTLASAKAIGAQLDTKSPIAGSGSIVTVGALDSGSITSGFSSIDVGSGAITTTGAVGTGPITTALSSATGILINQDYSDTNAATVVGLDVDIDKTGASTSDNTMIGVNVDMDNTTPTGGTNSMTGIKVTPTCTQVSGTGGTFSVKGMEVVATGSTAPENSTVRALDLIATGGDYTQGILIETDDANGWDMKILSSATVADFCTIKTVANGATTIETVDGSGADADLTFTVDGSFDVTATSASFAADVSIAEAKHINISAPSLPTTDHTSTGLTAQMLAGGAIGAFQTVCISTVANEVVVSDANAAATMPVIGICTAAAISDAAVGTILLQGFIRDDSWSWTPGGIVYASETAGGLTQTAPTTSAALVQALGVALSATCVYFSPGSVTTVEVA